ncbi:MAG: hypothetical protein HN380_19695 [Victivallales bacterium]|jgi:hypothetical protein|nr:hypothetical protein [Victivallales bacterium]
MAPRNNISQHYPRAAKLQLVRWREIDGIPQTKILDRAHQRWPELPRIHNSTWRSWAPTAEYLGIRSMVCEEQAEREQMSDLFQAAGGEEALSDVTTAASYSLAARAMKLAKGADDAAEIRKLMAAIKDARAVAAEETREQYEERIQAIEQEHTAAMAEKEAQIAQLRDALEEKTGNRELDLSKVADEMDRILE